MNLKLTLPLAVVLVIGSTATTRCEAQWSFSFGYSEGYRGHHHYPGHWHGYYGYHWYRPYVDYVYVAPPPPTVYVPVATTPLPVAQPNLSLSSAVSTPTPATTAAGTSTTLGTPTAAAAPMVRPNPLPAYQGTGVTIRNPVNSGARVSFVIDDKLQLDLEPGESTPLKEKGSYAIAFDRGGDFGTSRRVLGEGIYEFVATESGWELRREQAKETVSAEALGEPTVRRNALPAQTVR